MATYLNLLLWSMMRAFNDIHGTNQASWKAYCHNHQTIINEEISMSKAKHIITDKEKNINGVHALGVSWSFYYRWIAIPKDFKFRLNTNGTNIFSLLGASYFLHSINIWTCSYQSEDVYIPRSMIRHDDENGVKVLNDEQECVCHYNYVITVVKRNVISGPEKERRPYYYSQSKS
jgi:hypothetical protein